MRRSVRAAERAGISFWNLLVSKKTLREKLEMKVVKSSGLQNSAKLSFQSVVVHLIPTQIMCNLKLVAQCQVLITEDRV